jgi:hypothetical protein
LQHGNSRKHSATKSVSPSGRCARGLPIRITNKLCRLRSQPGSGFSGCAHHLVPARVSFFLENVRDVVSAVCRCKQLWLPNEKAILPGFANQHRALNVSAILPALLYFIVHPLSKSAGDKIYLPVNCIINIFNASFLSNTLISLLRF